MADSTIVFDIQAKVDEAVSQLSKVNTTLEKTNKAVFQGVAAWDILKGALNLASKAFNSVVAVMDEAIAEAASAQDEINNLNQALALNGYYSLAASEDLRAFADQIEQTTKFSQGQIITQLALAQAYGKNTVETKKLVQAATELSAATGMDLNSAVDALGKTYTGTGGILAKQVPILKGLTAAQLKNGDAVDFILKRFGGSASAQINTFNGALAQNKNTFDNLLESIGNVIVQNPNVVSAIKKLNSVYTSLTKTVDENKGSFIGLIGTLAKIFGSILPALGKGVSIIIDIFGALSKAVNAVTATISYLLAKIQSPLSTVNFTDILKDIESVNGAYSDQADAIKNVGKAIEITASKYKKFTDQEVLDLEKALQAEKDKKRAEDQADFNSTMGNVNTFISTLSEGANGAAKALSKAFGLIADSILPGIGGTVSSIVDLLAQSPEKVRETIQGFFDALPVVFETIISNLDDLIISFAKGMISAAPKMIKAMITEMPKAARALIKELPSIAMELVKGLAEALFEVVKGFLGGGDSGIPIIGGVVDVVGGFLGGIGDFLGFADGGTISGQVPAGYQNDTFPAMLTSGETVIDRNLTARLDNFLSKSSSSNSNQGTAIINIKIGEEQMANVLVNLNRQGFRTA